MRVRAAAAPDTGQHLDDRSPPHWAADTMVSTTPSHNSGLPTPASYDAKSPPFRARLNTASALAPNASPPRRQTARRAYRLMRLSMSIRLDNAVPSPLLAVVAAWSAVAFFGTGVLLRTNATTRVALALGSISVASAIFLILERSQPYAGFWSRRSFLNRSTGAGAGAALVTRSSSLVGHSSLLSLISSFLLRTTVRDRTR